MHFPTVCTILLLLAGVIHAGQHRQRAEPNEWFVDLVIEDQQHDSHDHSGVAAPRENHTCCHSLSLDEDPSTGDLLEYTRVPYNHWWRPAAMLLSVAPSLDVTSERLLTLNEFGAELDFRQHSVLYIRVQCAFPCCLEAADVIIPDGAEELSVSAGNATLAVDSWRFDPREQIPAGYHIIDGLGQWRSRHQAMWRHRGERDRLAGLQLCDMETTGMWIRLESLSRIEASLAALDVCFVHHDMAPGWDSGLCEEI